MECPPDGHDLEKAALCGEPSYVWRSGQVRRLDMILEQAGERIHGTVLENGCGVGMYVEKLAQYANRVIGLEYDLERAIEAHTRSSNIINAASEKVPFPDNTFSLILSHEVLEHVQDDHEAVSEMVRTLKPGGRMVIFVPNRGYPFETHGIYWRGKYHFGNIPLVNYLPRRWRNRLAPHVRTYNRRDLQNLFTNQPVNFVKQEIIFGAYDNIIARWGVIGKMLRSALQWSEHTPFKVLGLSHFWVVEKL